MLLRAVISNCCLSSGESESIANDYGQQVDNLLLERGGPFGPQHSSEHCAVNILVMVVKLNGVQAEETMYRSLIFATVN